MSHIGNNKVNNYMNNPNLKALMNMFGGEQETDEVADRINDLKVQLHRDYAIKAYTEIDEYINSMVADVNGRYEAHAFVRMYLKKACSLPKEVAELVSVPVQLGYILAHKLDPMVAYSNEDHYNTLLEDGEFVEELQRNAEPTVLLTEDERRALEKEIEDLNNLPPDEPAPAPQKVEDGLQPGYGEMYGKLDPKNPFGLN